MSSPLESSDLKLIAKAVEDAESGNMIEIVPVFIQQADFYEIAYWRAAIVFAGFTALTLIGINYFTDLLLYYPFELWLIVILLISIIGVLVTHLSESVKRLFAGKSRIAERASEKARLAFFEHEVYRTDNHIGVLLFVSKFEKRAAIMPDNYLTSVISEEIWSEILSKMIVHIKVGNITEGFIQAINEISQTVIDHNIFEKSENQELSDSVRLEN